MPWSAVPPGSRRAEPGAPADRRQDPNHDRPPSPVKPEKKTKKKKDVRGRRHRRGPVPEPAVINGEDAGMFPLPGLDLTPGWSPRSEHMRVITQGDRAQHHESRPAPNEVFQHGDYNHPRGGRRGAARGSGNGPRTTGLLGRFGWRTSAPGPAWACRRSQVTSTSTAKTGNRLNVLWPGTMTPGTEQEKHADPPSAESSTWEPVPRWRPDLIATPEQHRGTRNRRLRELTPAPGPTSSIKN